MSYEILVDSTYGVDIPKVFAQRYRSKVQNIEDSDWEVLLAGADHEHYWEVWNDLLSSATFEHDYVLIQDSDLFLVHINRVSDFLRDVVGEAEFL